MRSTAKMRLLYAIALMACVYAIGIYFYHVTEGWSYLDSIYFVTATVTTIGYGDIVPHTTNGRIVTIFLAWIGISLGFYLIYAIMDYRKSELDERIKKRFVSLHKTFMQAKKEMTESDVDTILSDDHILVVSGGKGNGKRKTVQE